MFKDYWLFNFLFPKINYRINYTEEIFMETIIGILIPFIGTVLGSTMVYFLKKKLNKNFERIILGFAAGVMVAASIWSLLIPSMELVSNSWVPASIGLILGIMIFYVLDLFLKKIGRAHV